MAKVKPATSRKMVKPQEQVVETAADEITTALDKLSDHLSKHLQKYMIGLAAICIAAAGINAYIGVRHAAAVERSDLASAVLAATTDSVAAWGDTETLSGIPGLAQPTEEKPTVKADHADTSAKSNGIASAVTKASEQVAGHETAAVVALVQSSLAFNGGDKDAAAETLVSAEGLLGEDSSLAPLLLEKKGLLAESKGDAAAAADAYTKLSAMDGLYYKVRGHVLLGDLKAATDAEAAKASYSAALDLLVAGDGKLLPQSLRSLRSEISRRKAQL